MLNLLFISDSPKIDYIKNDLQPSLKVIIDVVTDFDNGLKDVFDKRPTTVCIQDQIGGVTGESVARHIQMLLGYSAPTFILLHSGNGMAKAIKGLFEHLVDISQSKEALAEDIRSKLKSLLGDQWDKIYIPSKRILASVKSPVDVPEKSIEDADSLVNDLFSNIETSRFPADFHQPLETTRRSGNLPEICEPIQLISASEEVEDLLLSERNKTVTTESPVPHSSVVTIEPEVVSIDSPKSALPDIKASSPVVPDLPTPSETSSSRTPLVKSAVSAPEIKEKKTPLAPVAPPPTPLAAEFRISHKASLADEHVPEDLLLAFEENYRSDSLLMRRSVVIALVCVVCAAGIWFVLSKKPLLSSSLEQRIISLTGKIRTQETAPAPVVVPAQQQVPLPVPQPEVTVKLPAFIPKDGYDSSYAVTNPGWERYIGKFGEFRVFRASGRMQALQVLAVKDAPISEKFLRSVMLELIGSSHYKIVTRSTKAGVHIESGTIMDKGEVVIYRKNGVVKAFVVSINKM
jgi:flagellar FliL protein